VKIADFGMARDIYRFTSNLIEIFLIIEMTTIEKEERLFSQFDGCHLKLFW